jgi:hypothetical protein
MDRWQLQQNFVANSYSSASNACFKVGKDELSTLRGIHNGAAFFALASSCLTLLWKKAERTGRGMQRLIYKPITSKCRNGTVEKY